MASALNPPSQQRPSGEHPQGIAYPEFEGEPFKTPPHLLAPLFPVTVTEVSIADSPAKVRLSSSERVLETFLDFFRL